MAGYLSARVIRVDFSIACSAVTSGAGRGWRRLSGRGRPGRSAEVKFAGGDEEKVRVLVGVEVQGSQHRVGGTVDVGGLADSEAADRATAHRLDLVEDHHGRHPIRRQGRYVLREEFADPLLRLPVFGTHEAVRVDLDPPDLGSDTYWGDLRRQPPRQRRFAGAGRDRRACSGRAARSPRTAAPDEPISDKRLWFPEPLLHRVEPRWRPTAPRLRGSRVNDIVRHHALLNFHIPPPAEPDGAR